METMSEADERLREATLQEDWLRTLSWVLQTRNGKPIETLEELLDHLFARELPVSEQRSKVAKLMTLPSWGPAPEALKREAEAFVNAGKVAYRGRPAKRRSR